MTRPRGRTVDRPGSGDLWVNDQDSGVKKNLILTPNYYSDVVFAPDYYEDVDVDVRVDFGCGFGWGSVAQ